MELLYSFPETKKRFNCKGEYCVVYDFKSSKDSQHSRVLQCYINGCMYMCIFLNSEHVEPKASFIIQQAAEVETKLIHQRVNYSIYLQEAE